MKLLVACLDDRAFEYQGHADELNQSPTWPYFWMRGVMGDDWLQRVSFQGQTPPCDVRRLDDCMFVLYQSRLDAEAFSSWIPEAVAAVEHGYRTMRG